MQYSSFNQVEVSFHGPNNRNVMVEYGTLTDITPKSGSDHYACMFRYESGLTEHVRSNKTVRGHNLCHYSDKVTFDVDVKEDLEQAKAFTIELMNRLLALGIDRSMIEVYFSGSKGFHVQVPSTFFGIQPSVDLSRHMRILCRQLAGDVKIDTTIYEKNRLFRLVNTKNSKSGLYKVSISHDMLRGTMDGILEYAKTPQPVTVAENNQEPLPQLQEMWEQIVAGQSTKAATQPAKANKSVAVCGNTAMAAVPKYSKVCIAWLISNGISDGNRHNAALRLIAHLIKEGYPDDVISAMMENWADKCSPPADEEDLDQMIRDCRSGGYSYGCNDDLLSLYCSRECFLYRKGSLNSDDLKKLHLTDTGLAEFAFNLFDGRLLYGDVAQAWLLWDGRRWVSDTPGGLYPFIKKMLNHLAHSAFECDDSDLKTAILKELRKLESHLRQTTIIKAMTVLPELIVNSDMLDADPMLLNCLNGTLDLRTGRLLDHDPTYMITRIVNVEYDGEATCPLFERFMSTIFMENTALIEYVQRFLGYCLTGRTDEQVMLFCYGTGSNGKTTLLKLFTMLLSDFAASAQADLLMAKDNRGGASNEIARLKGARIVAVNEIQEGARLNEALVKSLTGGDRITARYLFREFFEFDPQFKLVMVGNHKPTIGGQDHGIWRRINLLPFTATIPDNEKDPDLLNKLKLEMAGILAWAVRGCLEWQQSGLKPPKEVIEAVKSYRHSEDIYGQWFDDCCVLRGNACAKSDLVYESFLEHSGMKHVTSNKLTKWLNEKGLQQERRNSGRYWVGVHLKMTMPLSSEEGGGLG